MIMKFT